MTAPKRFLVRSAARTNAEWCASMSRTHGVSGEFGPQAWTAAARTPPLYPDAVTLVPGAEAASLLARIDTAASGACVKDSFADLDLTDAGFQVLFEAQWIHRPASAPAPASPFAWSVVRDPATLRAWAAAWDDGAGHANLFRPELLDDPATLVLAGHLPDGGVAAGAVVTRGAHALGISNVFASDGGPDAAWPVILDAARGLFPTLPLLGYEHGPDLTAALRHGFAPLGPLRVWRRPTGAGDG